MPAFKLEKQLELWGKSKADKQYRLLITYSFCSFSGILGPKRKAGDFQVSEGFYYLDRFNPQSDFFLSLGINYPNTADRIISGKNNPGADVFIHGNCVTIGCIPITDEKIKELYVYAVEARNNGQEKIPVYIFPARLEQKRFDFIKSWYPQNPQLHTFWRNIKEGYDEFKRRHQELSYQITAKGGYRIFKGAYHR